MPEAHVHAQQREAEAVREREAIAIAELVQALATPSRVRLLYAIREREDGVGELAATAGITPSAASQQLRILRHLRFVAARRAGKSIRYRLHDDHVAALLDAIRNHLDHAALNWTAAPPRDRRSA